MEQVYVTTRKRNLSLNEWKNKMGRYQQAMVYWYYYAYAQGQNNKMSAERYSRFKRLYDLAGALIWQMEYEGKSIY